ncbi:hypothetical protein [Tannerella sp.]|uniref:hypothetical protein n=1 Tax=Tannerella sp. TaxID=2382127 RepID=UPI0026DA99A5|nr:hypothetical protein [Tannerella sp.]MDO4702891.1 hypothetical protein [Tannerella sp.]
MTVKSKYLIGLFLLALLAVGCRDKHKHPVDFYYWKADVQIGETERNYFDSLACERLFIRLFDIDLQDGVPVPVAKIKRFDATILPTEYVPVVFITNRTFADMTDEKIAELADHTLKLIRDIATVNRFPEIHEIKIDCDWTARTRNTYFRFLGILKKRSTKNISCTLRLHQIKDKKQTGVPPADKGYLMCYATSDPTGDASANSILDISLLKAYTRNINDYPLTFDVALPLYSWGIVTNHLGQKKLVNGLSADDLQPPFFRQTGEHMFEVEQDCFLYGLYINKGFTVKLEEITPSLLTEAKHYLHQKIDHDYRIVYFHLSKGFLKRFTLQELK